jgi:hypothetical protein
VRQNAIFPWRGSGGAKPAARAASATVRPNVPSVSSRSLRRLIPAVERQPLDGLNPTTPQNDAGRMTDPAVWVP